MINKILKILGALIIAIVCFVVLANYLLNVLQDSMYVPRPTSPPKGHPQAYWAGGPDGGSFVEIVREKHPIYKLCFYYADGDLISCGNYTFEKPQKNRVLYNDIRGYDGDEVSLSNGNAMIKVGKK